MMTLDEIRSATLNPKIVEEAHKQAEKRLTDVLDTKKSFEQKAFVLLNAYLTLSLAVFGVAGSIYKTGWNSGQWIPFFASGLFLIFGAISFAVALMDDKYGAIGSNPDMWLNKETIGSNDDTALYAMLAYITFYYQERINQSIRSNERKAKRIKIGISLGILSPIALMLSYFII